MAFTPSSYDAVLKSVFQVLAGRIVPTITGVHPAELLSIELPSVEKRFCDLLLKLEDSRLLHLELQTDNDPAMADRMLLYRVLLRRIRPDTQLLQSVIYFGNPPMRMRAGIDEPGLRFSYGLHDIREVDAELLLTSPNPAERILGLLCRVRDPVDTVHRILSSWAALGENEIGDLCEKLVLVSGLRGLRETVEEEIRRMAVDVEKLIRENEWFQAWEREGVEKGLKQGMTEGLRQGMQQGMRQGLQSATRMLRRHLEHRFGELPVWVDAKLGAATITDLDCWDERLLMAERLEDVFA